LLCYCHSQVFDVFVDILLLHGRLPQCLNK
jgi:hypothetical protein